MPVILRTLRMAVVGRRPRIDLSGFAPPEGATMARATRGTRDVWTDGGRGSAVTGGATALLLIDLQHDLLAADRAYARGGVSAPELTALPRVSPRWWPVLARTT